MVQTKYLEYAQTRIAELEKENKRLQKLIIDAIAKNERLLAVNAEYKRQAIEYANENEILGEILEKYKHTSNCPARENAPHKLVERGWDQCTCDSVSKK
jgi:hypothetical protein